MLCFLSTTILRLGLLVTSSLYSFLQFYELSWSEYLVSFPPQFHDYLLPIICLFLSVFWIPLKRISWFLSTTFLKLLVTSTLSSFYEFSQFPCNSYFVSFLPQLSNPLLPDFWVSFKQILCLLSNTVLQLLDSTLFFFLLYSAYFYHYLYNRILFHICSTVTL